jgi:hypothetical protein
LEAAVFGSTLAAAEHHSELAECYLGDPVLGAVEIAGFAQGEEPVFSLTVNGEEMTANVGGGADRYAAADLKYPV